jgi:XTP/dITP diphosphohydrolase
VGRVAARLASGNEHKLRELRALLPDWEIEPLESQETPEETGSTFYENAILKARFGSGIAPPATWTLAEDSGLEVEALGGRPGIYSARYAGPGATDADNVVLLLEELGAGELRDARYVSELVAISPQGEEWRGTGFLGGRIAASPRGSGGFGYDPVFVPNGEDATVAELGDEWKRERSHRAEAVRSLLASLGAARGEL